MKNTRYMTAAEVTQALNISAATLYSYVSRGLIRSEAISESSRERRYLAADVHKLAERKAQRRDPSKAAKTSLKWGTPVLESALTLIQENSLYYRGEEVLKLAQEGQFEAVAALLWTGSPDDAHTLFTSPTPLLDDAQWTFLRPLPILQRMQIAVALAAEQDLNAYDLRAASVAQTGARILGLLTQAVLPEAQPDTQITHTLAHGWQVDHPQVLEAALILCADHELNASSFTARVVASAEATPYAVVSGGLAALQGFKHGGHTRRVAAFLREVEITGDARQVIRERLQRGEAFSGFGHVLYPDGDPRGAYLLALLADTYPNHPQVQLSLTTAQEVTHVTGEHPTIDFALVTLERVLNLPKDTALGLFALGRTAGWIAHAIEQYASNTLIRPRAEYIGEPPHHE